MAGLPFITGVSNRRSWLMFFQNSYDQKVSSIVLTGKGVVLLLISGSSCPGIHTLLGRGHI
jgi:hypothetical protein